MLREVGVTLAGAFPRSEPLVAATRDLDRGRSTPEAVEALYRTAEEEVVALERRIGSDRRTAGYLRWADLFRPIAEGWGGFAVGPVTRWYETNTFYRQPILRSPPERTPGAVARALPPPLRTPTGAAAALVRLPGPLTLAAALENRSGETFEAIVHRLGRLLAEEVRELRGSGYRSFAFEEPELVVRPPRAARAEALRAAYRAIDEAAGDATTLAWTYFGDAGAARPILETLAVDLIGADLAETDPSTLARGLGGRGIALGAIDPRTTLAEDPAAIAGLVRTVSAGAPSVWLLPAAPLDLLPAEPAARKASLLAAARAAVVGAGPGGRP
ncbi:MAG: hypothetical protein QXG65_03000 [Thermoplasmata archaeon]